MIRKTLTILSLIGLLLSVAAWGASYWVVTYRFKSGDIGRLMYGAVDWLEPSSAQRQMWNILDLGDPRARLQIHGFDTLETNWTHSPQTYLLMGMVRTIFPLWIPTVAFAVLSSVVCLPGRRRRKRRRFGLCLKCGYNLKGLIEPRCPECGTSFGEIMMFSRRRLFIPRFSGELEFQALPDDLAAKLESRIQEGFLVRGNHARSNYRIASSSNDSVTISADDWWTAINVGLNEVRLRREGDQRITFEVSFWRWTGYAALLGMLIFTTLLGAIVFTDWMKPWLLPNRLEMLGSLSLGIFFCLCWPWILTEFHKKSAASCLERILHETFADAA